MQLWTVSNYHWYLKQSLDFGRDPQQAPACVCWDPEHPLRLQVVTRGWTSLTYDWCWTTDRSPGLDAADSASVAVIDGGKAPARLPGRPASKHPVPVSPPSDKVLVTTFRQAVVPPPMCSFELQLAAPANHVAFLSKPLRTNQLAVLTCDGQISVYAEGGSGADVLLEVEAGL